MSSKWGTIFDTCLSFGGVNAFSTVANACELNKRVIYARDASGHIIGRKLIGINEYGDLIGFHTYCSLREGRGNDGSAGDHPAVCRSFAAAALCASPTPGTVPTMFAEAWYDDGAVPWDARDRPGKPLTPVIGGRGLLRRKIRDAAQLFRTGPATPLSEACAEASRKGGGRPEGGETPPPRGRLTADWGEVPSPVGVPLAPPHAAPRDPGPGPSPVAEITGATASSRRPRGPGDSGTARRRAAPRRAGPTPAAAGRP